MSNAVATRLLTTGVLLLGVGLSCSDIPRRERNIFGILEPLEFDAGPVPISAQISSLGSHETGDVLEILVEVERSGTVFILRPDEKGRTGVGVIVDGGSPGEMFHHRVTQDGELLLFVDAAIDAATTATLGFGPAEFRKPLKQEVYVGFEDGFLAKGLFRPNLDDSSDRDFFVAIEPEVRRRILGGLRSTYEGTRVDIMLEDAEHPASCQNEQQRGEYAVLCFLSDSVRCDAAEIDCGGDTLDVELMFSVADTAPNDTAAETSPVDDQDEMLPDVSPIESPQGAETPSCPSCICFGRADRTDAGNQVLADVAEVFVGSFRPTGCEPSLIINSTNNIVNTMVFAGAHEIGHLIGLTHTALIGVMSPTPHLGAQRQLSVLQRSAVARTSESAAIAEVVQDPSVYFEGIFAKAD